ncbi:L-threonylcarbamoyladenylate synthase [Gracilibacillus alcaliphilus]|uniref:L-threonylcarbamoyladenylate synthase n=1 Tax=Gracilibacillus alcaliphilus TaxID=1401441 RepID=UPI00195D0C30|nr:L-threonylcarbamoyladenylate synthase [Gracilibacillus alcaliphilus]MBM7677215.1 L-threonylcarbamoyladenylate synthase [Gracilibacillus alcaliphilus]
MRTERTQATTEALRKAAAYLQNHEVVAFPTETVYGLGADATNEAAVAKIFQAKGRPSDNPLIVHVHDSNQIKYYTEEISPMAQQLIDHFMPGPFTIILKSNGQVAPTVTAGLSTVAIRVPDHPVARALLKESGLPLAAPSANVSGKPSPTTADHVYDDLQGRIACVLDGGATGVGLESTVVDATGEIPVILRPGGVTKQEIESVIGSVKLPKPLKETAQPKSPGMKYNHYEPDAPLYLIEGDKAFFQQQIRRYQQAGHKVGVLASSSLIEQLDANEKYNCGNHDNLREVAANLYFGLRYFNHKSVDLILSESFPAEGIGEAIMNRLAKAATDRIKNI